MANTKYALLSVYDKTGIVDFAKQISEQGYQIISTGGTAKTLTDSGVVVIPIQDITKNPESFDGRMKTISFQIESGILFDRKNPKHVEEAKNLGINPIDLVVCNLYPFEETINKPQVLLSEAIESIDVGGPTMVRSAAKNFKNVLVLTDPKDYPRISELIQKNQVDLEYRQELAAKAFRHLSFYDGLIAGYLDKEQFPKELTIPLKLNARLRYGENPHQQAALYLEAGTNSPLMHLNYFWGRQLSLVNLTDINAGLESIREFKDPCAVVIKHNTPCGIALGKTPAEALRRAIDADPESAFGGVIITNGPFDLASAKIIASFKEERRGNIDIIAATSVKKDALELLKSVRKTMGIYAFGKIPKNLKNEVNMKWVEGGLIIQTPDSDLEKSFSTWEVVTKVKPSKRQMEQMKIAWKFLTKMRSNAVIVLDKELPMTRGIGTGQTSRVRSTKIALDQAGEHNKGAVLASDSFFPFADSVEEAANYKIGVIIQQGDSINDKASIEVANKAGIPMVFTHRRAFWH